MIMSPTGDEKNRAQHLHEKKYFKEIFDRKPAPPPGSLMWWSKDGRGQKNLQVVRAQTRRARRRASRPCAALHRRRARRCGAPAHGDVRRQRDRILVPGACGPEEALPFVRWSLWSGSFWTTWTDAGRARRRSRKNSQSWRSTTSGTQLSAAAGFATWRAAGCTHPSSKLRIILFYVAGIYDSSTQDTRQDTIYRLIPDKAEGLQRCSRSVWAYAEGDRRRLGAGVLQGGGGAFPDSERGVLP